MSTKFTVQAPSINKSFQSGQILGGTKKVPNIDLVAAGFVNSEFTANISSSNTFYPFHDSGGISTVNDANSILAFDGFTSNGMINTQSFNIIKVDLHNRSDYAMKISAFYSNTNDLNNSHIKYSTIIGAGDVFYRNYPVENKFFNMAITKLGGDETTYAEIDGKVSMTKFTEFNTPNQLSDTINRFNMSNVNRDGNDFLNDILIDRVEDVTKTSRVGIIDSILNEKQNVWNFDGNQDFSSLTNTACVVRSSSINDTNLKLVVKGWSDDTTDKLEEEEVELNGTSNVGMIVEFKAISDMRIRSADNTVKFNNEGDVEIYRFNTNELMAQMKAGQGRMTSFQYITPPNYRSIIKKLQVNGNSGFNLESKLNLYKVEGATGTRELIYQNNEFDSHINNQIDLDVSLLPLDIVYAEVNSSNIGLELFGDSQYFVRANILEYPTSTNTII